MTGSETSIWETRRTGRNAGIVASQNERGRTEKESWPERKCSGRLENPLTNSGRQRRSKLRGTTLSYRDQKQDPDQDYWNEAGPAQRQRQRRKEDWKLRAESNHDER